ncbi:M20/M25/M40 family metallo-hydrolase [Zooshikella marina]|uniref:M20/M25/M40 family metallo-hydrolase n=1 Tax=Zooshikella ganghwensis TaxID=202772 RepID=UPI001BB04AFF|nr:M20/M25/M40 family metallo-hydrolase [Zooshikella ganghwensis]MBU2705626.1 M20/M25/M40 family metallo-hydrolase [Zooshikella ganghwensis]
MYSDLPEKKIDGYLQSMVTVEKSNDRLPVFFCVVAIVVLVFLISYMLQPPKPLPTDASNTLFSAKRAQAIYKKIFFPEKPHPTGSLAQQDVRLRLVQQLDSLGLLPKVRIGEACNGNRCGLVSNILAVIPGKNSGKKIVLTAHYDSVNASAGAADNAINVASLVEVAKALLHQGNLNGDIILLFTDAEEQGLLGASLFLENPLFDAVDYIINLEARGNQGLSFLIESGSNQALTALAAAKALSRPAGNSIAPFIYTHLPNASDMSIYLPKGKSGAHFAFFSNIYHYHTPLDSIDNIDLGSVQHQGNNVLELVKYIDSLDEKSLNQTLNKESLVYFDVLTRWIIHWDMKWTLPAMLLFGVAFIWLGIGVAQHYGGWRKQLSQIGLGFICVPVACILAFALTLSVEMLLKLITKSAVPWSAYPYVTLSLQVILAIFVVMLLVKKLIKSQRQSSLHFWLGIWGVYVVLGLISSMMLAVASYLFIVPLVVVVLCLALLKFNSSVKTNNIYWLQVLCWVPVCLLWLPLTFWIVDGIGIMSCAIITIPVVLLAMPLTVIISQIVGSRGIICSIALVISALFVTALYLPVNNKLHPGVLNHWVYQNESEHFSRHYYAFVPMDLFGSEVIPPKLLKNVEGPSPTPDFIPAPWYQVFVKKRDVINIKSPQLTPWNAFESIEKSEHTDYKGNSSMLNTFRVKSRRQSPYLYIKLDSPHHQLALMPSVVGGKISVKPLWQGNELYYVGLLPEGIVLNVKGPRHSSDKLTLTVVDLAPMRSSDKSAISALRNELDATPSGIGDLLAAGKQVRLSLKPESGLEIIH